MKWYGKSVWLFIVAASVLSSCSDDDEESTSPTTPPPTTKTLTLEDVLFEHTWEMYDWRQLEDRTYVNGKLLSYTETYAVTADGNYVFSRNPEKCDITNQFFIYGTIDPESDKIFPDTTYDIPSLIPALPYSSPYKILDDSTIVVPALYDQGDQELVAYDIQEEFIRFRAVYNNLVALDTLITTTSYILEMDFAPAGTKLEEKLNQNGKR